MFPPVQGFADPDYGVRSTDADASGSRLSAVQRGYLKDSFVQYLSPPSRLQPPRPPLINIGTTIRTESLDRLINLWLESCRSVGKQGQIVSLGAGSDTRFWRLATGDYKDVVAKYVELDFPEITAKKAMAIKKHKELSNLLEVLKLGRGGTCLHSRVYNLLDGDLRKPDESLTQLTESKGNEGPILDRSLPILLLFECVLVYMEPPQSSHIISWFTEQFNSVPLGVIVYEMFGLNDSFGRVMKNNLQAARNIRLPGVEPFQDEQALKARFTDLGFPLSRAVSLKDIRVALLPSSKRKELSETERIDEVEELDLVLAHYAISWAQMWPPEQAAAWNSWELKWDEDNTGEE